MKKRGRLRVELYAALMISPLALIIPKSLEAKPISKDDLFTVSTEGS
jgi:hypothetical protein